MATLIQENGIKELSKGTHGVVSNHGISSHTVPSHMVPDHEYCEASAAPEPAAACSDGAAVPAPQAADDDEETPEIDIMINNVVCSFSVKCHLNLRQIALNGVNVEFRRENGMVTMKLRRPYTTASIWSSGRVTCTGATSEEQAKVAARRYARALQKLGFQVRFQNFRVVNVLGTCRMPFGIRIISFSKKYKEADYEPELHPGVTYKLYNPKATLKIFSTGGVTITARSVSDVQSAVERIFPLVFEFRKPRSAADEEALRQKRAARGGGGGGGGGAARAPCAPAAPAADVDMERHDSMHLVTLSYEEEADADEWE
ncbi:TATA box-binding protein-like 1 [Manduca sexta]|uniref:TATA box-binding protein-like 1 n=1 Tax=Manduca sexta TaxID=7130 RepID=UPI001890284A|nr:TATA box-binding protein-like 1 [Manduca sexta]XP_037298014.1 TATA box-binding protein-like 1 [Manduca sexta]XP_037298015.1 TATA box-binding protein-like 1 [Manduca sexta]XP_037298016.1 TATA box-binding protein-like 1 [Manduca sexta]